MATAHHFGASVQQLAQEYRQRVIQEANLDQLITLSRPELRRALEQHVMRIIQADGVIITRAQQEQLLTLIVNDAAGFGPLESLLADPGITEIMVNGAKEIYVEREGRIEFSDVTFQDEEHVRHVTERIIAPIGRRLDESNPFVDARLPDGSRVNAIIPPISLRGTLVTIRKFRREPWAMSDLTGVGALTVPMARFLEAAVQGRLNVVVSGGTGSGKTTTLNVLGAAIPPGERVITIEDSAELRLNRPHVLPLECRPANVEGRGEINIRQLLKNALRMRPDRIVVGEVRGDETLDMLQAMNTGHQGSLTTVHANSAEDALSRLESMVVMAGTSLTVETIRQHLLSVIDLVVQVERLTDGRRKVVAISELAEVGGERKLRDLFWFEREGMGANGRVLGRHRCASTLPDCWRRLVVAGCLVDESWFGGDADG